MSVDSSKITHPRNTERLHAANKIYIKTIVAALALVVLIYIVSQAVALMVYEALGAPSVTISSDLRFASAYIASTAVSGALLLYVIKKIPVSTKSLWLSRPSWGDAGWALLGFGLYMLLSRIAFTILSVFAPTVDLNQKQEIGFGQTQGPILAVIFVAIVVAPALFEEVLFRGFLRQRLLAARMSYIATATTCSILFGLAHGQVNVGVDTVVLSLVMFLVLRDRRNIWVSIGIHALKNSLAFIAIFVFKLT